MSNYVAVVRRKPGEDIEHWKYIKREKKNGKWRYYYDEDRAKSDVKDKQKAYWNSAKKKPSAYADKDVYWDKSQGAWIEEHSDGSRTLYEDIIEENVIKENTVKENVIKENTVKEINLDKITIKELTTVGKPDNVEITEYDYSQKGVKKARRQYDIAKVIADGEKWIYNNVLDTKVGDFTAEVVGRGEALLNSWIKSLKKKTRKQTK